MDPTISVSKGCFVYKNGATRAGKKTSSKRKRSVNSGKSSLLGQEVTSQPFYAAYTECWTALETHIAQLQQQSYARTLENLVAYVAQECAAHNSSDADGMSEILPTAALLTGINQPDHLNQFDTLTQRLRAQQSALVCVLQSRDCVNLKSAVESMVYNLIEAQAEASSQAEADLDSDEEERDRKRLRRTQCTIKQLKAWYANNFGSTEKRRALVVILPDFECFNMSVLQDFILLLSTNCCILPFVLVLGVATAMSAVHSTLPYHVSSKIKLRVFQTQAAPKGLNELLDKVLLSPKYAFHLSGKTFKFLTHIFLYYDFSIQGFIQGFKYCLMEHYFTGNAFALCTGYSQSLIRIKSLTHEDVETIRRLPSFRPYVEQINDCRRIISILTDDEYLKKKLPQLLRDCLLYFLRFRCCLEFFTELVGDLPHCPLGKLRRELYVNCLNKPITQQPEYKECWQMLSFLSKNEFRTKVSTCIDKTEQFINNEILHLELGEACAASINEALTSIKQQLSNLATASMQPTESTASLNTADLTQVASRHELKAQLLQRSKQDKQQPPATEYSKALQQVLQHIETYLVQAYLLPLQNAPPLYELYVFSDIATVRRHIIGAPRAALHTALHNPHFYMQCKCCELQEQSQLLSTMPDLSVIYKLHLECGRMINLFDWLQAFRAVQRAASDDPDDDEQQRQIEPQMQARFTRAVAELQFLGYIKMSKRKTDHATRLTW